MTIDDLTIGEVKKLAEMFSNASGGNQGGKGIRFAIGEKVIIRTYAAGVWFGTLVEKDHNEVILHDARRMYRWHAKDGISLSECARNGIESDSRICAPVARVWLEAIEIIPCNGTAILDIEGAKNATP